MPAPVEERPALPAPKNYDVRGLQIWGSELIRQLIRLFQQYGYRINSSLNTDGDVAMKAPLPLQSVVIAALPAASDHEGAIIYVSDGSTGQKFRGSDGTNWVNLG